MTPEERDTIAHEAWERGYTAGHSNAMRQMSDEPGAPKSVNPYPAPPVSTRTQEEREATAARTESIWRGVARRENGDPDLRNGRIF